MMPPSLRIKHDPNKISSALPPSLKLKEQKEEFAFEEENDLEREVERNIAQQTSRIGEAVLGAPGDIWSFAKSVFGFDSETNLPTSESLRKKSEEFSQGYTKPKNEFEEKIGEVQQDIASFLLPGSGTYGLVRNIGIPVVANLAQEGIKYAGGDKSSAAAKIGTMIALDLLSHRGKGARSHAGKIFEESENLIKEGTMFHSPEFEKSLGRLKKTMESGGSKPSTEKSLKKIEEIQGKMKNGNIEVKELMDFRKSINEMKDSLGGFNIEMPPKLKKRAIAHLDDVKGEVIQALDDYGSKFNQEFRTLNRSANEAYAALEKSEKIGKFISDIVGKVTKDNRLKLLFGLGTGYLYPSAAIKTLGTAIPALGIYEGYKVFHQVMKSPTLRKFYGNILKGAASGNAGQVSRNMKALENNFDLEME